MSRPIVTHSGKIGDMIFSVPTMRALRKLYGHKLSLVVTPYCSAGLGLVMDQADLVEDCAIYEDYRPTADQPGMQPREVATPEAWHESGHRDVHHLGLPRHPLQGECLTEVPANVLGLKIQTGPWLDPVPLDPAGHVVIHAPLSFCGSRGPMADLLALIPKGLRAVVIGTPPEFVEHQRRKRDQIDGVTLKDVSDMGDVRDACIGASMFIGVASSPAAVAAGLGLPSLWVMQMGGDERAIPRGCDVKIVGSAAPE